MYIKSFYKFVSETKPVSEYKKLLKTVSPINLRRSSKYNILATFGAVKCLENIKYSENLPLYISSEYGCAEDMLKVLNQVNSKNDFIMPFDFLNINGNNAGFFISQALLIKGKNITISSQDLSFEKALELAYFDFQFNSVKEFLIGGVDESLEYLADNNKYIRNLNSEKLNDGSSWIYFSNDAIDSFAKLEFIKKIESIDNLNDTIKFMDYSVVSLNQFAYSLKELIIVNPNLILHPEKDTFYGTSSVFLMISLIQKEGSNLLHISLDRENRGYIFSFKKTNSNNI